MNPYVFSLTEKQIEMFEDWKAQFDDENPGPIGGTFSFVFTPTTLFTAVTVKHISGAKFDLTDYNC